MKKTIQINDGIAKRFGIESEITFNAAMNDAESGIAFMISQLAHLETKAFETPYADIIFQKVVPILTDAPEWATNVNYISYDSTARGKFIGASARDLGTSAIERQIHSVNVAYGGLSLVYSLDDLRKAIALGMNLDAEQARIAFRGAQEHQQDVVLFGDEKRGMQGFLNHDQVALANSSKSLATVSVSELVDEVNTYISEVWTNSNQRFLPNTLCIDSKTYARLANARLNDTAHVMTGLEFLKQYNLFKVQTNQDLQIIPMPHLSAENLNKNGVGEKARMVIYDKNDSNVASWMPIAPRFIAPQATGLEIVTPMEYKFSGTEFRYPGSAMYVEFNA